jgi:hypothetical protein
MPGNPRNMITVAERRFPVRIRIGVPAEGLRQRHTHISAWLDENCGADGWAMTPSGMHGVLNDAVSIYFLDATLASAFVARWCAGYKVETAEVCSGYGMMSRWQETRRACIGRHSAGVHPAFWDGSILRMPEQVRLTASRNAPLVPRRPDRY